MNLVLDEAEEVSTKRKTRKPIGAHDKRAVRKVLTLTIVFLGSASLCSQAAFSSKATTLLSCRPRMLSTPICCSLVLSIRLITLPCWNVEKNAYVQGQMSLAAVCICHLVDSGVLFLNWRQSQTASLGWSAARSAAVQMGPRWGALTHFATARFWLRLGRTYHMLFGIVEPISTEVFWKSSRRGL